MLVLLEDLLAMFMLLRIQRFNLTNVLNGSTSTILAPTNDAFSVLSEEEFSNLVHVINTH